MSRTVAIVGGGVAGTAAAYALSGSRPGPGPGSGSARDPAVDDVRRDRAARREGWRVGGRRVGAGSDATEPVAVTVDLFEASSSLGGRVASRERDGCRYDYGANYVTAPDARFQRAIDDALGAERVAVDGPIWVHDGDGTVREGRDEQPDRWTGYRGLDALPAGLAAASDATVHTGARVERLARVDGEGDDGWRVTVDGTTRRYDAVVLATDADAAARLVGGADWDERLRDRVATAAAAVPHRTVPSVACHYPVRVERPYYALVNPDGEHRVGWLSREECKPGHVPDGESLLVVQLSPVWTAGRQPTPGTAVEAACESAATLLDDDRLREPDWTDAVCWTAAQPERGVDPGLFERTLRHDLGLAGDWIAGTGRTFAALQTGLDAGRRVRRRLG